ncbi:MAG: hypothetical protein U0936_22205 [Planctomycetaceae bacterium]
MLTPSSDFQHTTIAQHSDFRIFRWLQDQQPSRCQSMCFDLRIARVGHGRAPSHLSGGTCITFLRGIECQQGVQVTSTSGIGLQLSPEFGFDIFTVDRQIVNERLAVSATECFLCRRRSNANLDSAEGFWSPVRGADSKTDPRNFGPQADWVIGQRLLLFIPPDAQIFTAIVEVASSFACLSGTIVSATLRRDVGTNPRSAATQQ